MDNGLFDKYAFKINHNFIAGGPVALSSLGSDDVRFYCAAEATHPGLASGVDGKLVAAPLVGLPPYVLISRKRDQPR